MVVTVSESKFLHQIHIEEKFGNSLKNSDETSSVKKKPTAAIGYKYDEDEESTPIVLDKGRNSLSQISSGDANAEEDNDSESDIDLG